MKDLTKSIKILRKVWKSKHHLNLMDIEIGNVVGCGGAVKEKYEKWFGKGTIFSWKTLDVLIKPDECYRYELIELNGLLKEIEELSGWEFEDFGITKKGLRLGFGHYEGMIDKLKKEKASKNKNVLCKECGYLVGHPNKKVILSRGKKMLP